MTSKAATLLATALFLIAGSTGCRTITPSVPRYADPNGEVWLIETRSLLGLGLIKFASDIYHCRQLEEGGSECREAEMVDGSMWFPTAN